MTMPGLRVIFRDAAGKMVGEECMMDSYSQRAIKAVKKSLNDPVACGNFPKHAYVTFGKW